MSQSQPRDIASAQRLRLVRTLLSIGFYVLCDLVMAFCAWYGLYPLFPLAGYSIGVIVVSATFLGLIHSGRNLRFSDPSMTKAQTIGSILLCSYTIIYAGPLRGTFIYAYVISIMFAGMHLSFRQLIHLALLPLALFPFVVALASRHDPAGVDWRIEFVHWISLWVILGFTTVLTGTLSQLRASLKASNAELKAALARLTEMAERDALTGLYNRRYLLDMLHREKNRAERSNGSFCVCVIDIDHFKRINDTWGHGGGDIVLRTFAGLAARCIRSTDLLGRWGGEEFLLILPETSIAVAESCILRIQRELAHVEFAALEPDFRVTVSAGIAPCIPGQTMDELIECADQAMYAAKRAGRNRVVKADEQVCVK
ncbi:GGDEF domain-containing protein [Noviherbaspirillum sp.]|uniref:GGDEF domain-containing protein n=1 Tax=Noviherbaspirillum sp. TaxID=1926288 RepID=UPI002B497F1E|nr:GGDEF domain-containing protein [Noviherbaspirillum sp.]HJV79656.1 GGDEF domain-containing protein [Noviherbaspirillum sp.]